MTARPDVEARKRAVAVEMQVQRGSLDRDCAFRRAPGRSSPDRFARSSEGMVSFGAAIRTGCGAVLSDGVEHPTGRKPEGCRPFAKRHRVALRAVVHAPEAA